MNRFIFLFITITFVSCTGKNSRHIVVFAGSASLPPLNEISEVFFKERGIEVKRVYGGSGSVLSTMIMSKSGDIYLPGSPDFMDIAIKKGVVNPSDVKIIAYLVPAIIVKKGNPKKINCLHDLLRPDVTFAIGDPRSVCVGLYGAEILEKAGIAARARFKIKTYGESCEKTANLISMGAVDAVMGWDVFARWNPETSEVIEVERQFLTRVAYIPVALTSYSNNADDAKSFIDFICSDRGKAIYKKYGYITDETFLKSKYGNIAIGGSYKVNEIWK